MRKKSTFQIQSDHNWARWNTPFLDGKLGSQNLQCFQKFTSEFLKICCNSSKTNCYVVSAEREKKEENPVLSTYKSFHHGAVITYSSKF